MRRTKTRTKTRIITRAIFLIAGTALLWSGCSSPPSTNSQAVSYSYGQQPGEIGKKPKLSQIELQEQLQRLSSNFIESIASSSKELFDNHDPSVRIQGTRLLLRYVSSSLDIATSQYPEVNLLDMAAFLRLSREVLEKYWIPVFLHEKGRGLIEPFREAEEELTQIMDQVSTKGQQQLLYKLIQSWQIEHPHQTQVEWVRLSDFSTKAGKIETQRSEELSGLLSGLNSVVASADQAILLGNRAMFLGQRIPFLLRLQARLGATEILSDSMGQFDQTGETSGQMNPLIQNLSNLVTQMSLLVQQTTPMMVNFRKYFPHDSSSTLTQKLSITDKITSNLAQATSEINNSSSHSWMSDFTKLLLLIGASWSLFFWGGYYLAKRATAQFNQAPKNSSRDSDEIKPPSKAA